MDEVHPKFLNDVDVVGLSWLRCLYSVALRSGAVPLNWQTWVVLPIFKKGDKRVYSTIWESHSSASTENPMPGCWKEESVS